MTYHRLMPVVRRPFAGESDLLQMQRIVSERTHEMGPGTNLHPGDVAHRIYSGLRAYDLAKTVPVWEDVEGIAAFGIIWPKYQAFDVVARAGLDTELLVGIVAEISELTQSNGRVETDVSGGDPDLVAVLTDLGFTSLGDEYAVTGQSLSEPVEVCPSRFLLRSVSSDDVDQLAAVHSSAFGGEWTPENYLARMRQPGYDPAGEIVAVDVDGTFAGFTITWYDELNKVGYFEPVGVHAKYQRRGIGSALLQEGMVRMQARGMTTAEVVHEIDGPTGGFYRSNGFALLNTTGRWQRDD